jgi:ABC-type transporter Mla MlaB component
VELQLSVVFEVTADEKQVRLVTTGHLTVTNQQVLYPMIHRARALTSTTEVIVDLSAIEHFEAGALDLLSWEIDHNGPNHPAQTVRFILPESPPVSGPPSEAGDAT